MTKDRVRANTSAMSRRTILAALPATGATLALPAAANPGKTEILRLFHRYRAIREAAKTHVCTAIGKGQDDEMESLFWRRTDRLVAEMMALPSTCAADMAAKMIVAHCDGDFTCLSYDDPAWLEARQLTGSA